MAATKLPAFDENIGPDTSRYLRAEALSLRLQAQRDRLSKEHHELIANNRNLRDTFSRENNTATPREPTRAEKLLAELDGETVVEKPVERTDAEREALARSRELGASSQDVRDAIQQLGEKTQYWRTKACAEFCQAVREEHYAPVAVDVAKALVALAEAVDRHDAFMGELHAMGVTQRSHLLCVELPRWRDLLRQLRSAAEHGYLKASAIKAEWRDK